MVDNAILSHPAIKAHLGEEPVDFASIDIPAVLGDGKGAARINRAKFDTKWQWIPSTPQEPAADPQFLKLDPAVGAAGEASAFVERPGNSGMTGDVEFLGVMAKSTGRFGCQIKSQSLGNLELCNTPGPSSLIFGKSTVGAPWPVSIYEIGTGALDFTATNLTALENDVLWVPYGRRFMSTEAQASIEARRAKFMSSKINPYFVFPDAKQNGQSIEFTLPAKVGGVEGELDLVCTLPSLGAFLAICPLDDSTRVGGGKPAFKVQIQDGLTGYQLMPDPISVQDFVAACNLALLTLDDRLGPPSFEGPFAGIFTHLFAASTKIHLHFTSQDAAVITVRFGFRGVELRYAPAPGRDTNGTAAQRAEQLSRNAHRTNISNIFDPPPGINPVSGG